MRIRGERECRDCGTRWTYYETGSVTCPECGSIDSRGLDDERRLHTASPEELDLSAVRSMVDDAPLSEVTDAAEEACRAYVRRQGFVRGGDLLALDDTYLAAAELAHVADVVGRRMTLGDEEERYLLALLSGADAGDRPEPDAVPSSLRAARGLAVAEAVRDYRRDCRECLDDDDPAVAEVLTLLEEHVRRVRALQGDVPPATAERLVAAARDVGAYLRDGEEAALATAHDRLDRIPDDS